jgi:hypothetical protein
MNALVNCIFKWIALLGHADPYTAAEHLHVGRAVILQSTIGVMDKALYPGCS